MDSPEEPFRVFGYGSLFWRPGFEFHARRPAILHGYHRAFCRLSVHHRGTVQSPGMVVGLMPGGSCEGMLFEVAPGKKDEVLAYLDQREGPGYHRSTVTVHPTDATTTSAAITYIPNPAHPTYAPNLPFDEKIEIIRSARGASGTARDYLADLVAHLEEFGIDEPELRQMLASVDGVPPVT